MTKSNVADPSPVVIIGSGLAGYTLARELRKRSHDIFITVVTADGGEVYTKPMLSNAFTKGHAPDDLIQKSAATLAEELGIAIRAHTRVVLINRATRGLTLSDGSVIPYNKLVLALGADPRVFPAPGSGDVGIDTVNDLDDYRAWRARIGNTSRILLIGAGLIGCEFANDLANGGFHVSVVDPAPWPLARLLPKELGLMLTDALGTVGVESHLGRTVASYEATSSGFVAILDNGTEIPFDHALSAVGLAPRTKLATEAGLGVRAGIVVDQLLRTDDPSIFALGDCAETKAGLLPFIAPLLIGARALAATLTGEDTPLHLPALPVVVKTLALPLVVCPPRPGSEGAWTVMKDAKGAVALFKTPDGEEIGFALAGAATSHQHEMAKKMPDILSSETVITKIETEAAVDTWVCNTCGWVYDPRIGDPDSGIRPGTSWTDVPDDWECPTCGVSKSDFSKA